METSSASFVARHDAADAGDAVRVLDQLEATRAQLAPMVGATVEGITVVLHGSDAWLVAASPFLPIARRLARPAARRAIVGWVGRHELHVLAPPALRARAQGNEDDRRMLERAPSGLYVRLLLARCNPALPPPNTPPRLARYVRWAWLVEGGAHYLSGQTAHARSALARRLRSGPAPRLPPPLRDAPLLGGSAFDLLARREGIGACVALATHLDPRGPVAALQTAFGLSARDLRTVWATHLGELTPPARRRRGR